MRAYLFQNIGNKLFKMALFRVTLKDNQMCINCQMKNKLSTTHWNLAIRVNNEWMHATIWMKHTHIILRTQTLRNALYKWYKKILNYAVRSWDSGRCRETDLKSSQTGISGILIMLYFVILMLVE